MTVSMQTEPCEETVIVFGGAGFIGTHLMGFDDVTAPRRHLHLGANYR